MVHVGVIGLGMMGATHLDVYGKQAKARILAISDIDPDRLSGKAKASGNIEGQAQGGTDLSKVRRYDEGMKLIADPDVELVDICLPTPLHRRYAEAALAAGKHVLVEKPLARTADDARALAEAARDAKGVAMVAMCMRFWPGWDWLKDAIDAKTYGPLRSLHLRRLATMPPGFYSDGKASGGAVLDLHVHDTDFVQYCLGMPAAVFSRGYSATTGEIDHLLTHYLFEGQDAPALVCAEGGWTMAPGFNFKMHYTANFEKATAVFDLASADVLTLYRDGQAEPIKLAPGMGYDHEITYLLDCIEVGRQPTRVTLEDAARSVRIVEAECQSIATGKPVVVA